MIVGNTVLYGATAGRAFFRGLAGERFAVRNSGAGAVVEGVGDHGCEYMTGGRVVVLGRDGPQLRRRHERRRSPTCSTRRRRSRARCNMELVGFDAIGEADAIELYELIEEHHLRTLSPVAARILEDWEASLPRFVKVMPHDYKRALADMAGPSTRCGRDAEVAPAWPTPSACRTRGDEPPVLRRVDFIVYILVLAVWGLFVGAFARLALPGRDPDDAAPDDGRRPRRLVHRGTGLLRCITGGRAAPGFLGALVFSVGIVYVIRRRRGGGLTEPRGPRRGAWRGSPVRNAGSDPLTAGARSPS